MNFVMNITLTTIDKIIRRMFKGASSILLLMLLFLLSSCHPHIQEEKDYKPYLPEKKKFIFVAYGDSRDGHDKHRRICDLIIRSKPELVVHTGDLVNNGKKKELWKIFNSITKKMRAKTKFYPCLGNHELESKYYFQTFELPGNEKWYYVLHKDALFICLDMFVDYDEGSEQNKWLRGALLKFKDKKIWKIVFFHEPIFGTGRHKSNLKGRRIFHPLFKKYGVHLVLAGHNHCYERCEKDEIFYITTGGGGAGLHRQKTLAEWSEVFFKINHFIKFTVKEDIIVGECIKIDGRIVDRFVILK